MIPDENISGSPAEPAGPGSELIILADGTVLAHNIIPEMAALLSDLDPANEPMRRRAACIQPNEP